MNDQHIPFSSRYPGEDSQIKNNDFPPRARNGLLHIFDECIKKRYIESWIFLADEVRRTAREPLFEYRKEENSHELAQKDVLSLLEKMEWRSIFNLCERVYRKFLNTRYDDYGIEINNEAIAKGYFSSEINYLLKEESIAYQFKDGNFFQPGLHNTQKNIGNAFRVLGRPELSESRKLFIKAKTYFEKINEPDYENCVKDSVAALEAAVKVLFPDQKDNNFVKCLKNLEGIGEGKIPPAIISCIEKIYAFRGAAHGVAHGGANGGVVTAEIAELFLSLISTFICYFVQLHDSKQSGIPF